MFYLLLPSIFVPITTRHIVYLFTVIIVFVLDKSFWENSVIYCYWCEQHATYIIECYISLSLVYSLVLWWWFCMSQRHQDHSFASYIFNSYVCLSFFYVVCTSTQMMIMFSLFLFYFILNSSILIAFFVCLLNNRFISL